MSRRKLIACTLLLSTLAVLLSARAQFGGRGRRGFGDYHAKEQEEMTQAIKPGFMEDTFTFARLRFDGERGYGWGNGRSWEDDAPEADLTLTYRVHQTTCVKVRPGFNVVDITAENMEELENYPFVYVAGSGRLDLNEKQAAILRRYLLNGGFLMAEDFWGDDQWRHFSEQMKRVFPDRNPVLLNLDDRIFHAVFDFKKLPQIPSVGSFMNYGVSYDAGFPFAEKGHDPLFYAIYDDKQRMMVLICHNNHFGDGWEHEGDDESYFSRFSEPMGYPMFINILFYASTH